MEQLEVEKLKTLGPAAFEVKEDEQLVRLRENQEWRKQLRESQQQRDAAKKAEATQLKAKSKSKGKERS